MRRGTIALLAVLTITTPQPSPSFQGEAPDSVLEEGIRQVRQGDFKAAILILNSLARRLVEEGGNPRLLARTHVYLSVAHLGLSQVEEAKATFLEALNADKDLELSPEEFPPRFMEFFQQTMREAAAGVVPVPPRPPTPAATPEPTERPPRPPADARTNSKDGLEYVWIPPGSFQMGCVPEDSECQAVEKPRHAVSLSRGFWLGRTEVTVAAYRRFARATGRGMPPAPDFNAGWRDEDHPIVNVTWHDASAYCEWAGSRLPTEAEWEYAARGGREGTKYPWGQSISHENANYEGIDGRDRWTETAPVGSFAANGFGLHDMTGNVWEWCVDWFGERYYGSSPKSDPRGASSGGFRVLRGGSWNFTPSVLRLSVRFTGVPSYRAGTLGMRCASDGRLP